MCKELGYYMLWHNFSYRKFHSLSDHFYLEISYIKFLKGFKISAYNLDLVLVVDDLNMEVLYLISLFIKLYFCCQKFKYYILLNSLGYKLTFKLSIYNKYKIFN